jgi:hypothetical protein
VREEGFTAKLMPLLGKYVQARGTVYERKGMHAIVIRESGN